MKYYILLLFGVLFNVSAQLLLKTGVKRIGEVSFESITDFPVREIATNGFFWLGIMCYGSSLVIYLIMLTRFELSTVYPVASTLIIFIITTISILFFGESFNIYKIIGTILCMTGVFMVLYNQ
jgi:multidrug transporter EmrE-like cation transporter